ncbi:MAG: hypothetical protein JOZ62_22985 [Acidobacteriaceae bacterium]|nr:hypothetical protein [Acidobacteriaceae bacterium]
MCGIAGVFNHRSKWRVDAGALATMRDTMAHRGPDGGESWISPEGRGGPGASTAVDYRPEHVGISADEQ